MLEVIVRERRRQATLGVAVARPYPFTAIGYGLPRYVFNYTAAEQVSVD